MFKLALTAGHYFHTPGKRCLKAIDVNETREWWLNDRIADRIEYLLSEYEGIEILRTDDTSGQTDVSLSTRTTKANNFKANFYLSIHHNAGVSGGSGGGIQAYVYPNVDQNTLSWQREIYDELIKLTGLKGNRSQGLPQSNLYEVRETNMPAVLLELGFMDSTTDVPIILTQDYAYKCAQACVNVIVRKSGIQKKIKDQLYRVRLSWGNIQSQQGAYSSLDNAIERCQSAGDGYKVYDWNGVEVYAYVVPIVPIPKPEHQDDVIEVNPIPEDIIVVPEPIIPDPENDIEEDLEINKNWLTKLIKTIIEILFDLFRSNLNK